MTKRNLLLGMSLLLLGVLLALPAAEVQAVGGLSAVVPQGSAIGVQSATPAPAGAPVPRAPTVRSSRGWMPVLGSLAAGGLLGALFGGNVLFGILMVALVVAFGAYIVRLILRTRGENGPAAQLAGIGSETVAAPPPSQAAGLEQAPAVAQSGHRGPPLPEGFDLPGMLRTAKLNFVRLQVANDVGRLEDVREFATGELYAALVKGALERSAKPPHTDVVSLNAELTALATEGDTQRATIRFSGMARATPGAAPTGFSEIWQLARPANGSTGWLLAGIRQVD
jgi:predicted lipid-binding transport protein (Tim44 family)